MTPRPIPFAPIARHAVIGDRRTAALVAADGTLDWLCLPDYGGEPIFGALIDSSDAGGWFRFGPVARAWGAQRYLDDSPVVETCHSGGTLVGQDAMIVSEDADAPRVIVRKLRADGARTRCIFDLRLRARVHDLRVFFTHSTPATVTTDAPIVFDLEPGEEAWAVLAHGDGESWSIDRARAALENEAAVWRAWASRLTNVALRRERAVRSLITLRLLGHAPTGALVASPTTSLPERIGGDWNADYRFAWVRDASLSMEALAGHGDPESAERYFRWLVSLVRDQGPPLRVLYGVGAARDLEQHERKEFTGHRGSKPVRFGNRAVEQKQLGMYAFLAHCALVYLRHGGAWRAELFDLIARCADYVAAHWSEPDNGIWELGKRRDHVSSRVMCWVALVRAAEIADATNQSGRAQVWREQARALHAEVLERGYDRRTGSFRQEYGSDAIDASALLIPIMGFLPGDDPRVVSTVDRVARELTIEGHVHRFVPPQTPGIGDLPLGDFEGSFLLCTSWLASAYACGGRRALAEATLARVEGAANALGLLSEGVDARSGELLGNFPLLFSHAEYLRALTLLQNDEPRSIQSAG